VLLLVLTLLAVGLALAGLLYIGTRWIQGYIYSEPAEELHWRAPAAAAALAVFLTVWCLLAYKWPGDFDILTSFSPTQTQRFDTLTAIKRQGGQTREIEYTLQRDAQGRPVYLDRQQRPFRRGDADGLVEAVVVEINGQAVRFLPEMNPDGTFLIRDNRPLRFVEENGSRVMTEDLIGYLSTFRWGLFLANLFLNFFFLVLWIVCLWLLLQFQVWHAVGLGGVCWAVTTFALVPMLLGQAERASTPDLPQRPEYNQRALPALARGDGTEVRGCA
jgi:hypothetical protein